jgi:hypothetical protein
MAGWVKELAKLADRVYNTPPLELKKRLETFSGPKTRQAFHLFTAIMEWRASGFNAFEPSEDLCAALLLTETKSIDLTKVKLPYPGFTLSIPDKLIIDDSDKLSFTQLVVGRASNTDGDSIIQIHALGGSLTRADLWVWFSLDNLLLKGLDENKDREFFKDEAGVKLKRLVISLLAYMNSVEGSIEKLAIVPSKKTFRYKEPEPKIVRWALGRTIKIDPQLIRAAKAGHNEPLFKLKYRFVVRGHFRNQACGPALSERKQKWIGPHWKGPTEGTELIHTYKVI